MRALRALLNTRTVGDARHRAVRKFLDSGSFFERAALRRRAMIVADHTMASQYLAALNDTRGRGTCLLLRHIVDLMISASFAGADVSCRWAR